MAHDWSMSTSTRGGLTLGLPATAAEVGNWPARASTLGSLINNLNHLADERSRVLVSYPQRSTTTGGRASAGVGSGLSTWTRIYSWGPFPILVGHDGNPYPVRVRVGGRADPDQETCLIRIGVCALGTAGDVMTVDDIGAGVVESSSFVDETNEWRASGLVTLAPVWRELGVVDGVSSASPATVKAVLATIEVWGVATGDGQVICSQAYAAEQVAL